MLCFVYRSNKRDHTYVYMAKKDDFEILPAALSARLGLLELVLEVDLDPQRKLAKEDAKTVLASLAEQGWYLQLPRDERSLIETLAL